MNCLNYAKLICKRLNFRNFTISGLCFYYAYYLASTINSNEIDIFNVNNYKLLVLYVFFLLVNIFYYVFYRFRAVHFLKNIFLFLVSLFIAIIVASRILLFFAFFIFLYSNYILLATFNKFGFIRLKHKYAYVFVSALQSLFIVFLHFFCQIPSEFPESRFSLQFKIIFFSFLLCVYLLTLMKICHCKSFIVNILKYSPWAGHFILSSLIINMLVFMIDLRYGYIVTSFLKKSTYSFAVTSSPLLRLSVVAFLAMPFNFLFIDLFKIIRKNRIWMPLVKSTVKRVV